MNEPLESLHNKVTTFFHEVIKSAANRSCWWYGIRLDASDPNSLAQVCGITTTELETMFDACGFINTHGNLSRDAFSNFAKGVPTCDVSNGKPTGFKKSHMFLKVGTGATHGLAYQFRKLSTLERPSSATRSLKECQKRLRESLTEWSNYSENIQEGNLPQPPTSEAPISPVSIPVAPSTPPPTTNHISGLLVRYDFLVQFIKPEALSSTDLWKDDVDENDFIAGIEEFVKMRRERNDLTSPIRSLLGVKKISETIDVTRFPLMTKKGINLHDNMEIQALLRELVLLNDEVESVQVLEYAAYNDVPQTLLRVPRSSRKDLFAKNAKKTGWVDKLLGAVLPEEWAANELLDNELEDEDEIGTNLSVAAWWLIRFLGDMYPDKFIKAANDIGMPIHSEPMDQDQAFAMFCDANIGV